MGTKINNFLNSTKQNSQKCFTKFSILQNKILKSCSNYHQLPYFIIAFIYKIFHKICDKANNGYYSFSLFIYISIR